MFADLRVLLAFAWLVLAPIPNVAAMTIEEAIAVAVRDNTEVLEAQAETEAARARLSGASLLLRYNPQLRTAGGSRSGDNGNEVEWAVELSQPVEIAGQRSLRIDAATLGMRRAEARLATVRTQVEAAVRTAFGRAVEARAIAGLARESAGVASESTKAAGEKHEAGSASLIEVNSAQVEQARALREALEAQRQELEGMAELRRLLGLDAADVLTLEEGQADLIAGDGDRQALRQMAYQQRGDLIEAELALAEAKAEATLAAREAIASPSLGVSYSREEGADVVMGVVSVPLPIFDRNQAARGAAAARVSQSTVALQAARLRVDLDVDLALQRLHTATEAVKSATGAALDAARQNRELAAEGYSSGKLDFVELLVIRREALAAERAAIESRQELHAARAELMRSLGSFTTPQK